jgi:hypothetical protein
VKDIRREEEGRAGNDAARVAQHEALPGTGKRTVIRCSICKRRAWMNITHVEEPPGVPEPRQSWMLCRRCNAALLSEMERSPVLSPLRLRIAMGLVAAERSPDAYAPTRRPFDDRTWILVMAWGFGIAMLLHLVLIVMIAVVAGH